MNINDEEIPMTKREPRWAAAALVSALVVGALVMLLVTYIARGAEYTRQGGTADFACCADSNCATVIPPQYAREWSAKDACTKLTDADGVTRYVRQWPMRVYRSGAAPPVEPPACPQKPADDTRTAQCPAGTTGSWQQVQSYGSVAYPTCWVPNGYIPSSAPDGACVTPPPATLPAPTAISATVSPNATNPGNHNVALSWLAVSGASGYAIERCVGANCTENFVALGTTTNTAYTNPNLPASTTYRYRIRGTAGAVMGAWSALRNVTTPTATTPPPPPATGTASLSWTPPTENTNGQALTNLVGYRIDYGRGATALTSEIVIPNAAVSSYLVENLAAGTWYFGVTALAGDPRCLEPGAQCIVIPSARSNLAAKAVP